MGLNHSPSIVMDGLVLCVDAANNKSYPGILGNELVSNSIIARIDGITFNVIRDAVQNIGLTVCSVEAGKTYYVDYLITSYTGTTGATFRINNSGANLSPIIGVGAAGRFNRKFTAVASGSLSINGDNTGTNFQVDYVSVREVLSGTGMTWFDLSSNGKNVTLINGTTFISDKLGAMSFDGIDDYVSVQSQQDAQLPLTGYGNFTGADTSPFTISLWVSTTQLAGSSAVDAPALVGRDNGDLWANLNIYNGYVYYLHYNGAWVYNIASTTMIATGSWYNVVYVNNTNETGSLYINGIPEVVNQSSSLNGANYFSPDYIGRGYNGRYFNGKISSVFFYDRSLSTAEIQQNFNALRGRYGV